MQSVQLFHLALKSNIESPWNMFNYRKNSDILRTFYNLLNRNEEWALELSFYSSGI